MRLPRHLVPYLWLASALVALAAAAPAQASHLDASALHWKGERYFAFGANLPWYNRGCDFGCGSTTGVAVTKTRLASKLRTLSRNEMRVIRWWMFDGAAPQVRRQASGAPAKLAPDVFTDLAAAVDLAERYDLYLHLVLFPNPDALPQSWLNDPVQRQQLADVLAPLFRRYAQNRHVMTWEIFNEPEHGIDSGVMNLSAARATVRMLAGQVQRQSRAFSTVGSRDLEGIRLWRGLELDYFAPHWYRDTMGSGATCATCTTSPQLRTRYGISVPIVIGSMQGDDRPRAARDYAGLLARGYAGGLVWSAYPEQPQGQPATSAIDLLAGHRFAVRHRHAGPREERANPCTGELSRTLLCPDMQMPPPFGLVMEGRYLLRAGNSIDSVGRGPVEVLGTRSGRRTMSIVQRIKQRGGGRMVVDSPGSLFFKYIPRQGPFWKVVHPARFELWRIDAQGRPTRLVRTGPKVHYCLRDYRLTHPGLAGTPRRDVYPRCSQNPKQRRVVLGTSVGWSDIYGPQYPEQWISVRGLRGCFAFVHRADPFNAILESNEDNNTGTRVIRLPYRTGAQRCAGAGDHSPDTSYGGGDSY